jgi:hypothetical protein
VAESGRGLNLVEVWFGIIERQAIHRGAFPSVRDLMIQIRTFINGWNDRCQPFVWTKTANQILKKPTVNNFSCGPLAPKGETSADIPRNTAWLTATVHRSCPNLDLTFAAVNAHGGSDGQSYRWRGKTPQNPVWPRLFYERLCQARLPL